MGLEQSGIAGNVGPAERSMDLDTEQSDSADLATYCRGIHIGTAAGNVTVVLAGDPDGTTRLFYGDKGAFLPLVCKRVMATGTTATGLIGLY